jgi:hypothetical protein
MCCLLVTTSRHYLLEGKTSRTARDNSFRREGFLQRVCSFDLQAQWMNEVHSHQRQVRWFDWIEYGD